MNAERKVPLSVDLDGTLISCDLLYWSARILLRRSVRQFLLTSRWLLEGKAAFKQQIAAQVDLDPATLPYNLEVLSWVRMQKKQGRYILLCTGSDQKYAKAIGEYLACFDDVCASDGQYNLVGINKANYLIDRFGKQGFDYVGNSRQDIPVWKFSRSAVVVTRDTCLIRRVKALVPVVNTFSGN